MPEAAGKAIILRPGEGRSIDLGTFGMSLQATADDTGSAFSLLETNALLGPTLIASSRREGIIRPWPRTPSTGERSPTPGS
jgi:hypothetical protein